MIPSSSTGCCPCDSEPSTGTTPSSGVTGIAGCSGNYVPCITVTNGIVTALTNREIASGGGGATGTAGCSGDNVACITVSNGLITAVSDRDLGLKTAAYYDVPAAGNATSGQVVLGSDSRLTDQRTPTAHASTHAAAGSDPLTLSQSQITNLITDLAAKAPLASPTFTGIPAGPTAAVDTNTTQLATTGYVIGQGYLKSATAATIYAPIASPTFTGSPAAPSPATDDSSTKIATTAYVIGQASSLTPSALGTASPGGSSKWSRGDHVHPRQITNLASEVSGVLPFANLTNSTSASKLLGRGSASGSGPFEEITIGTGLSLSGTTLNATNVSDTVSCGYTFFDGIGNNLNVVESGTLQPFPDTAEPAEVILDFVPTSIRMTLRVLGATPAKSSGAYLGLQYSTNGVSGWTSVGLQCPITVDQVLTRVTDKVNVSLSGSPLYFRLVSYCPTSVGSPNITIRMLTVTFIK